MNMASVNSAPSPLQDNPGGRQQPSFTPKRPQILFLRLKTDNTIWLEAIIPIIPKACSSWTLLQHRGGSASPQEDRGEQSSKGVYFTSCFNDPWTAAQFPSYGRIPHGLHPQEELSQRPMRPVALTSLVMKAIERVINRHIFMLTDPLMDPLQFAYCAGRGGDDAKTLMDTVHKHL